MNYLTKNIRPIKTASKAFPNRRFQQPVENYNSVENKLKMALVKKLSTEYTGLEPRLVYQAVNEAHALAALTSEPLLFLPALAEEKVQQAEAWASHQRAVHDTGHFSTAA
jgi:hypothetical protein